MAREPFEPQRQMQADDAAIGPSSVKPAKVASPYRPERARMAHIDALRGLALLGVIVMNVGAMAMSIDAQRVLAASTGPEMGLMAADILLMFGKARASFAFLFGAGFALLLGRAAAHGADFKTFYVRRLLVLLGFGLLNQIFLFWGDILVTYALLGFILLGCRNWSDGAMLKAGLILALVPPVAHAAAEFATGGSLPDFSALAIGDRMARGLAAYSSSSYLDAVRENILLGVTRYGSGTAHMVVGDLAIFGLFLLGAWSVRSGLLTDPQAHARTLRRVACWCIPAGLLFSFANMLPMLGIRPDGAAGAAITASSLTVPVLAAGYLAGLSLLFTRRSGAVRSLLAAAGRMALTNYLLSGTIGSWVLYGWGLGLLPHFGIAELTAFGVGLFLALSLLSRMWLAVWPQGPAEVLWRRLAYGAGREEHRGAGEARTAAR